MIAGTFQLMVFTFASMNLFRFRMWRQGLIFLVVNLLDLFGTCFHRFSVVFPTRTLYFQPFVIWTTKRVGFLKFKLNDLNKIWMIRMAKSCGIWIFTFTLVITCTFVEIFNVKLLDVKRHPSNHGHTLATLIMQISMFLTAIEVSLERLKENSLIYLIFFHKIVWYINF